MDSPQDTIAALATPLGEGGLGVIRVSGLKAIGIVSQLFHKGLITSSPTAAGGGSMIPGQKPPGMTAFLIFPLILVASA